MVVLGGGALSYERGTPVGSPGSGVDGGYLGYEHSLQGRARLRERSPVRHFRRRLSVRRWAVHGLGFVGPLGRWQFR